MVPAYTLPHDADHIKILRTLVKETLGRSLTNALAEDIAQACAALKDRPDPLRAESLTVSDLAVSRRTW